jgi:hypothetical protein
MQRAGDAAFPSLAEALARGDAFFSAGAAPFPSTPSSAARSALLVASASSILSPTAAHEPAPDHGMCLLSRVTKPASGAWAPIVQNRSADAKLLAMYDSESDVSEIDMLSSAAATPVPTEQTWHTPSTKVRRSPAAEPWRGAREAPRSILRRHVNDTPLIAPEPPSALVGYESDKHTADPEGLVFGYESEATGSPISRRASIISKFSDFGSGAISATGAATPGRDDVPLPVTAVASCSMRRVSIAPVHIPDDADVYDDDEDKDEYDTPKETTPVPSAVSLAAEERQADAEDANAHDGIAIPVDAPPSDFDTKNEYEDDLDLDGNDDDDIEDGGLDNYNDPPSYPPEPEVSAECVQTMRRPFAVVDPDKLANVNIEPDESLRLTRKKAPRHKSTRNTRPQTKTADGSQQQWRELKHLDVARARKAISRAEEQMPADENEPVRKSKRQRFPVLKYWKNETILYERRKSQIMPTIAEITIFEPEVQDTRRDGDEKNESYGSKGDRGGKRKDEGKRGKKVPAGRTQKRARTDDRSSQLATVDAVRVE